MSIERKHIYLIDGSGFIFRAFHALPALTRQDGTPIGAVLGFCNIMLRLLESRKIDYLAVVFDSARQNFRHDIYPNYKANRAAPPEELIPQFPMIREACTAFNFPQIEQVGYEADDLIATLTRQALLKDCDVTIVSSDKDLMQLIQPHVLMLDPIKSKIIDAAAVFKKFGVLPNRVIDVQSLAGDSSDNIPGVPGIGVKTAAELINQFGDLDNLFQNIALIKQNKRRETLEMNQDSALISRKLVTLMQDVPLEFSIEALKLGLPQQDILKNFLNDNSFRNLYERALKRGFIDTIRTAAAFVTEAIVSQPTKHVTHYQLVDTAEQLKMWLDKAVMQSSMAFDTETTGLDPQQAQLVGFSLAITPGQAIYVPLNHKQGDPSGQQDLYQQSDLMPGQLDQSTALGLLKPILENEAIQIIGHNLKYDQHIMARYDISLTNIEDTMVMSYDLFNSLHGHSLDELSKRYLNIEPITYSAVTKVGRKQITFDYVPLDQATQYAAEDADLTLQLFHLFYPQLPQRRATAIYKTMDLKMVPVLSQMEREGVFVNTQELQTISSEFASRLKILEHEIYELAGEVFLIGSPKQLGDILFTKLNLNTGKKGKSGAYSTDVDVMEDLASQGHLLPAKVLEWRQLAKLKSTYTDALVERINPHTGRVHTNYGLTITATGRLSSSEPNLQNIPVRTIEGRRIRQAFQARPGYTLISADYSQIELRLLAHMGNIPSLIKAFKEDQDIHIVTAADVFGIPLAQVDAALRRQAKAINFGIIYGISAFGLARQLGIPRGDAGDYITRYLARYPEIKNYMEQQKAIATTQGYVETIFGRRCYIQGIAERNFARRGFAERQAINAPLQGSNADIIKMAMIQLHQEITQGHLEAKLILQVHDELIFEVAHDKVEIAVAAIKKIMEKAAYLSVPLKVDVGQGANWDQAH